MSETTQRRRFDMAVFMIGGKEVSAVDFIKKLEKDGRKEEAAQWKRRLKIHGRSSTKSKTTSSN